MFNKDTATTIIGAMGAVTVAIDPVMAMIATPTLHGANWMQLATAGLFALLGYFTNKK